MSTRPTYRFMLLTGLLTVNFLTGCATHRCGDCCSPCNEIEISNVRCNQCENCPKAQCGCSHYAQQSVAPLHEPITNPGSEVIPDITPDSTPEVAPEAIQSTPENNSVLSIPSEPKPTAKPLNNYPTNVSIPPKRNIFSRMGKNISNMMKRNKQNNYQSAQNKMNASSNHQMKANTGYQTKNQAQTEKSLPPFPELEPTSVVSQDQFPEKSWRPLEGFSSKPVMNYTETKSIMREQDIEAWPYPVDIQDQPILHTKKTPAGIQKISQEAYPNKPMMIIPAIVR